MKLSIRKALLKKNTLQLFLLITKVQPFINFKFNYWYWFSGLINNTFSVTKESCKLSILFWKTCSILFTHNIVIFMRLLSLHKQNALINNDFVINLITTLYYIIFVMLYCFEYQIKYHLKNKKIFFTNEVHCKSILWNVKVFCIINVGLILLPVPNTVSTPVSLQILLFNSSREDAKIIVQVVA